MKRSLLWLLVVLCTAETATAQLNRYIIQLNDKATSPFSFAQPQQYLSQRSIDRRTRYNIAIDSTDLPVTPRYLDSLRAVPNVTILNTSKWLNQVAIQTTDAAAIQKINSFSFVKMASPIAARTRPATTTDKLQGVQSISQTSKLMGLTADYYNYGTAAAQVRIHNGDFLHNIGLRGQNMIIGMLDAGYYNYTSLKAFDSINANSQVLGTWDFVTRDASVVEDHPHGMQTLSVIAANIPGQFVGTAPKASFYLYRTEDAATEYPIEEHNWVVAAEKVDSAGGDVISSSLGYYHFDNAAFNYTYADMNGNRTIAANGADQAAKKGILIVNAAGNEGANSWKYIMTPADGDSVLAVGAVDVNGQVASFSSYGPTSDGQVKPDVASVGRGTIIQYTNNTIGPGDGTSFACPNMAGLTTCLWQGFRELNNMKIINALRQAGNNFSAPNDRVGYGVPDVKKAVTILLKEYASSTATISNCKTALSWNSKDAGGMKYEIERKAPGETAFTKIAEKAGSGSVFANHSYQLTDSLINLQSGAISYRIRQVIDTAATTFSADYIDTVTVNMAASCVLTGIDPVTVNKELQIVPNPATHSVVLRIKDPSRMQKIKIVIMNAAGQTVDVHYRSKPNGAADFELPIHHLAKGRYTVVVYNNTKLLASEELLKL